MQHWHEMNIVHMRMRQNLKYICIHDGVSSAAINVVHFLVKLNLKTELHAV